MRNKPAYAPYRCTLMLLPLSTHYRYPSNAAIALSLRAAAALQGFHTEELDRDWIYDTGAGTCFIGWDFLTDHEKRNVFQHYPLTFETAGGTQRTSTAVMCNVPYIGKRPCYVLKD